MLEYLIKFLSDNNKKETIKKSGKTHGKYVSLLARCSAEVILSVGSQSIINVDVINISSSVYSL